jgi:hypothetical protein
MAKLPKYFYFRVQAGKDKIKLEDASDADVVEVVRCKDCKYNCGTKMWVDHEETADCTNGHGYPPLDWFCADGKRKNNA